MKKTKIEWCDSTFNPITGCLHSCPYCYARTMVRRFSGDRTPQSDKQIYVDDFPCYEITSDGETTTKKNIPYPHGFSPTFHRHRLEQVRHWKDDKPRNIFICSMADMFGDWVPDEWIVEIMEALEQAPQHNYLFLTKNPIRMQFLIEDGILERKENYWYGSTVTTEKDLFMTSIEANTFVSIEPILEPLKEIPPQVKGTLKWALIGAETGNRKDKVIPEPEWIVNLVRMLKENRIPIFMKDSLIPIIGEQNMLREFPEGLKK